MTPRDPQGDRVRRQLGIPWCGRYSHPTLVMGIVNVTPDSFQAAGRYPDTASAVAHGLSLAADGADMLDIGGESTRPGCETIPVEVETARVVPVVAALTAAEAPPVSVDTRKAEVAEAALAAGARIINDVSAGRYSPSMFEVVATYDAFLCLMHAPLDLGNMKWSTEEANDGSDIISGVSAFLSARAEAAVAAGVNPERIWLDPGFGFGKTVADNLALLRGLDRLTALPWPVLVGTSRKSTLGAVLDDAPPEDRLEATLSTVALAIRSGAAIVRVHDIRPAVRVARTADAILYSSHSRNTGGVR